MSRVASSCVYLPGRSEKATLTTSECCRCRERMLDGNVGVFFMPYSSLDIELRYRRLQLVVQRVLFVFLYIHATVCERARLLVAASRVSLR